MSNKEFEFFHPGRRTIVLILTTTTPWLTTDDNDDEAGKKFVLSTKLAGGGAEDIMLCNIIDARREPREILVIVWRAATEMAVFEVWGRQ